MLINIIYRNKYYSLYSNHISKGTIAKSRANYSRRQSYQEAFYGITGANHAWFRSKEIQKAEENYC